MPQIFKSINTSHICTHPENNRCRGAFHSPKLALYLTLFTVQRYGLVFTFILFLKTLLEEEDRKMTDPVLWEEAEFLGEGHSTKVVTTQCRAPHWVQPQAGTTGQKED